MCGKKRGQRVMILLVGAMVLGVVPALQAGLTGALTTADGGVFATEEWSQANGGFKINWDISQATLDNSLYWCYNYVITDAGDGDLSKTLSHWVLQLSKNFTAEELLFGNEFNNPPSETGDLPGETEFGDYGPDASNPGMPVAGIHGVKFGYTDLGTIDVIFYTKRNPIWSDFYAKSGGKPGEEPYAYNADFGAAVSNLANYNAQHALAMDGQTVLAKILAPDTTVIPAPGAALLSFIGIGMVGRIKRYLA